MNFTVIVAALGYFVDLFDISLFGVVRVESLNALGITDPQEVFDKGIAIYNWGMVGMIIGGFLWGVLADKFGRLSVLFGSILIYSLGTIANAFVWDADSYAICRFVTSIGLAGELGAAITLVSESLPPELRGVGTTIVAGLGLSGSVAAVIVGNIFSWKTTYLIGGSMGLILLVSRFKMLESAMYQASSRERIDYRIKRGYVRMLFKQQRLWRYIRCIALGLPIYFVTGILFTFSTELSRDLGIAEGVDAGPAILFGTIGLSIGDFLAGLLSQYFQSRKKAVAICLAIAFVSTAIYLTAKGMTPLTIYMLCFFLGMTAGYWAVLITVAAEQFGTNLRGTVATTVPNLVRGSAVLATILFSYLKGHMTLSNSALVVGTACFAIAFLSLYFMEETYGRDLQFEEID